MKLLIYCTFPALNLSGLQSNSAVFMNSFISNSGSSTGSTVQTHIRFYSYFQCCLNTEDEVIMLGSMPMKSIFFKYVNTIFNNLDFCAAARSQLVALLPCSKKVLGLAPKSFCIEFSQVVMCGFSPGTLVRIEF
ncbi:hypothetical protein XENOCAPTIV_005659 [Xenoophorus captivus]|uniref:Uncharacterized protein n=1 Tax=Xenoophorus captivus TaxID=1517983 RepID=A0ABV0QYQ2_9TELE